MDTMDLVYRAINAVDPTKAGRLGAVTPTTEIAALGMDSVATMEMVAFIEEQIGTTFSDEALVRVRTFGDLITLVQKAQGSA